MTREAKTWQSEKLAAIAAASAELYHGLYDGGTVAAPPGSSPVRLLNPHFSGDDPTALRFAQLEVE